MLIFTPQSVLYVKFFESLQSCHGDSPERSPKPASELMLSEFLEVSVDCNVLNFLKKGVVVWWGDDIFKKLGTFISIDFTVFE